MWMITSVSKSGGLSIVLLGQVTNAFFLRIFFVWSKYFKYSLIRKGQTKYCSAGYSLDEKPENLALVTDRTLGLDENQRSRHFFFGFVSGGSSAANIASSKTFFNPFWKCKKIAPINDWCFYTHADFEKIVGYHFKQYGWLSYFNAFKLSKLYFTSEIIIVPAMNLAV